MCVIVVLLVTLSGRDEDDGRIPGMDMDGRSAPGCSQHVFGG